MVPSLDPADTTPALSTIDESLDTGQRDPRRWRGGRQQKKDLGTRGRFSRRLQLAPGLVPPSSWSLSPCFGPATYLRAESLKSPAPDAICLRLLGSTRNLAVWRAPPRQVMGAGLAPVGGMISVPPSAILQWLDDHLESVPGPDPLAP